MKAVCKLCQAVIETEPDTVFDENRDKREFTAFWNRLAYHIDPRNRLCANDGRLVQAAFAKTQQDNGWFQRWRLLARVTTDDAKLLEKMEDWRDYLHTITSIEASSVPVEKPSPPPVEPERIN